MAAGSIDARVALGYMHYKGELGEADLQAAVELFESRLRGWLAHSRRGSRPHVPGRRRRADGSEPRPRVARACRRGRQSGRQPEPRAHVRSRNRCRSGSRPSPKRWYLEGARAGFGQAQLRLFYLLLHRGEDAAAIDWIAKAAAQDLPQAQNDYAWLLSTSHSEAYRDGELALTYAERAVAQVESAAYLDTLAAAYAELGLFAEAITTQEQALALVTETGSEEALALAEHLAAYREGQPWRE